MAFVAVILLLAGLYGVIRGKVAGPINTRGKSALLLVAGVIVAMIGGATSSSTPSVATPPTPVHQAQGPDGKATATPAVPEDPYNYTATIDGDAASSAQLKYKGKVASGVGVAVIATKEATTVGSEYFNKKPQGKFLLVQVAITNQQKNAITLSSGSFKILTNGKEYGVSSEAQIAYGSDNGAIIWDDLNPDLTKIYWFVFDVPTSLDTANAQLQFQGGITGKKDSLPLAPIKG